MTQTSRRTLLKALMVAPIAAAIAKLRLFGWDNPFTDRRGEHHEERYLAVRILRLINTAERHYFEAYGQYAFPSELWRSEGAMQWLDSIKAQRAELGRLFFSTLRFDRSEIAKGWEFQFKLSEDRQGYLVAVNDISGKGLHAFVTDQQAIISEGDLLVDNILNSRSTSAQALIVGQPIDSEAPPRGKIAALFRSIAIGPITALADCGCVEYPCCCACSCEGGWAQGCANCGCTACIWCCCPY